MSKFLRHLHVIGVRWVWGVADTSLTVLVVLLFFFVFKIILNSF